MAAQKKNHHGQKIGRAVYSSTSGGLHRFFSRAKLARTNPFWRKGSEKPHSGCFSLVGYIRIVFLLGRPVLILFTLIFLHTNKSIISYANEFTLGGWVLWCMLLGGIWGYSHTLGSYTRRLKALRWQLRWKSAHRIRIISWLMGFHVRGGSRFRMGILLGWMGFCGGCYTLGGPIEWALFYKLR